MYITQDVAARIKAKLKEQRRNTKEMLSDLDMGINAISEFAKGKQMSCISLARIADYLDCSVDYLLGRSEEIQTASGGLPEAERKLLSAYRRADEKSRALVHLALNLPPAEPPAQEDAAM